MSYAFITRIKDVKKHRNADRLQVGNCFGNQVVVSLDVNDGDLGVYFATDSQLGKEYCEFNNLVRKKDEQGNNIGGYLDSEKRNIRALKLRGEVSDGLFMPIISLEKLTNISKLKEGDCVDILDGVVIASKYIPRSNKKQGTPKEKVKKFEPIKYPLFEQHIDTKQFAYCKNEFNYGDLITISLKMHGTSGRTSNSIKREYTKDNLINKLMIKFGIKDKYKQSYGVVSGSRRVTLTEYGGGYYGTNEFRKEYNDYFDGKLRKGETIYYEIVGYTGETPIMSKCSNKKTQDKEFIKKYGKETVFSYGCDLGENDIYVYRMTMTNEDGDVVEYPTKLVQHRCEQMNVKCVPVFEQFFFTTIEDLEERVDKYSDGTDPIGKTHIREGCVVRVENREKFKAYKHKNFHFKVLEGIIKDAGILDMEEQESLEE